MFPNINCAQKSRAIIEVPFALTLCVHRIIVRIDTRALKKKTENAHKRKKESEKKRNLVFNFEVVYVFSCHIEKYISRYEWFPRGSVRSLLWFDVTEDTLAALPPNILGLIRDGTWSKEIVESVSGALRQERS